jgi:hypothetical protein
MEKGTGVRAMRKVTAKEVEKFIREIPWSYRHTEDEKRLVAANIREFAQFLGIVKLGSTKRSGDANEPKPQVSADRR